MEEADRAIKELLGRQVYRHPRVLEVMTRAEGIVTRLFARYFEDMSAIPLEWRIEAGSDDARRARRVADFLAGMTDRYAVGEYQRLFDVPAELG